MAPKKRLSDLLREEVKKPAEAGDLPPAEAEPAEKAGRSTGTAKSSKQHAQSTEPVPVVESSSEANSKSDVPAASQPLSEPPADQTASDSTAHLQAALEQTKTQEAALQQQIATLEAELKQQAESTRQLQAQLQQAETHGQHLETELSEAKHTVLQLVEVNTQLKQDLENLKARSLTQAPVPSPSARSPQQEAKLAQSSSPSLTPSTRSQQEMLRRRQQDSLAHPVFPAGPAPGHLSEKDLGWVD